jgi:3-methyladenine DNA glycosylase AlkD
MRELAALEQRKMREANERRGDDHGINLTELRALAKRLKTQHELALQLWATGDTAARLLATLVCRPKAMNADELDAMVHDIRSPKLLDWFIVNMVKPGRHAEELRVRWKDGDDLVGRAGWSLTTDRVVKKAEGLDLDTLVSQIEKGLKRAPAPKQWTMNHCLAEIGIHHARLRKRASKSASGSKCSSITASPAVRRRALWIAEMVGRRYGKKSPQRDRNKSLAGLAVSRLPKPFARPVGRANFEQELRERISQ